MKTLVKISFLFLLVGLIVSCKPKGEKAETGEAGSVSEIKGKDYTINTESSLLKWEAAKVGGKHNGTVKLSDGKVTFNEEDELVAGNFTIDMGTITVLDLNGDMKGKLETHLKGTAEGREDDFFNVPKFPTAKFEITKATRLMNNDEANYIVNGNLTIKDTTKEVSFRANVNMVDGKVVVNTPAFVIDRTEWGIKYRSLKFFDDVADRAINDEFALQVELTAG